MATRPIRLVIADDARDLRDLVRTWFSLEDDFEVVGEAADGVEAIEVVAQARPDVILLDAMMPELDGVGAISGIKSASPETTVVLFSAAASQYEEAALAAGAALCIDKTLDLDGVTRALRSVCLSAADS